MILEVKISRLSRFVAIHLQNVFLGPSQRGFFCTPHFSDEFESFVQNGHLVISILCLSGQSLNSFRQLHVTSLKFHIQAHDVLQLDELVHVRAVHFWLTLESFH
jgi:hypothetical protein